MTNSQYGYFNPSTITFDQIKTNIRNLVLTNKGERYMHPDFGCDIYRILFEPIMIEDIKEKIKINITKQMNF
ncbi:MAG: GPW/gp25 family protein [Candidatus Cloacimonetes bacterium]|nr:GPW/gp25 family protein [Candidatus Cloacimonadota bacterium]